MDKKYIKKITEFGSSISFINGDVKISFNETPGNRHYEEYLEWIAEGNEPEVVQPEVIND